MIADTLYVLLGFKRDKASEKKVVDGAEATVKKAENVVSKGAKRLGRLLSGTLVALAPAAFTAGLVSITREASAAVDELGKAARAAGITAEAMQELEFAAASSGVPINDLRNALPKLGRKISEAAKDNKTLQKTFADLNLNARELKDLAPDEQFTQVAEALSKVDNNADRMRLSMSLLEEVGPKFATMFAGGAEGLNSMREQARNLGLVLDGEVVAGFEDMENNFGILQALSAGLKRAFIADLMPAIQELLHALTDVTDGPAPELRDLLRSIAKRIAPVIRSTARWVKQLTALTKALGGAEDAAKILGMAVAVLAGARGLVALTKVTRVAVLSNLRLAASAVAAAFPYIAMAAAVGLVLLALDDLRGWIEGEDSLLGDVFGEYDADTLKDIQGTLIGIGIVLATILGGTLGLAALLGLMAAALVIFWDDLGAMAEDAFVVLISGWDDMMAHLDKGWDDMIDSLADAFVDFAEWLESLWDSVVQTFKDGAAFITEPFDKLGDKLGGLVGDVRARFGVDAPSAAARTGAAAGARSVGVSSRVNNRITVDARGMTREDATAAVRDAVADAPVWGNARDAYADAED